MRGRVLFFRSSVPIRLSLLLSLGFRISVFGFFLLTSFVCLAQPKNPAPPVLPIERAEGERLARELIANLLVQKPSEPSSNSATIRIRDADGQRRQQPVTFQIVPTPTNYITIYEILSSAGDHPVTKLTIGHADTKPNEYLLNLPDRFGAPFLGEQAKLGSSQLMNPFAGSDFWIADLGLEFLHWPEQRILRKEMRKNQFCAVLQSINPNPSTGYARVVSWIAINHPEDTVIVHADAYDAQGKLLKEFDPKKIEKINGMWQLEEMEMRNMQTGSKTLIDFNLERK
ncbi:MAG: hypothetical protein C5B50_18430 [Verrucomicrobia bacterium]|nr:MAG: hypothetical protein C5B50_18430 [Verrucomicrobiota bacterium]